jgi:prepilin-type N-terminal cleavage/methylation domain-containing protein
MYDERMYTRLTKRGFTIIELVIVIAIIGVLSAIVVASAVRSRSFGRDAQVKSDTQILKLVLARAAQADPNQKYPGSASTWYCLKTAGTCFRNGTTGAAASSALNTTLSPFLPGGTYPTPPFSKSGEYRFDSYVYTPSAPSVISGYTGAFIVWWQEKPILSADCNGYYAGQLDTGVYYCYEKLQ